MQRKITTVLFDFDGTVSTLRHGWEEVMGPMFVEKLLACGNADESGIAGLVDAYIDESTGIQTILQMKWLAEEVKKRGGAARDPWEYKDEYNERLMRRVEEKKRGLLNGTSDPDQYLIKGSVRFLRALRENGIKLYVASGTDHEDVVEEAKALKVFSYFDDVCGAPRREEKCSKEAVMRRLICENGLRGEQLAVIGDGKVEIALGKENHALAIGLASDEDRREGINPVKKERLVRAGADVIYGDFQNIGALLDLMGIGRN